ncbi:MAG TPA: MmgE/PrpD family protein [Rectinema sp.]|jgi:2-methylcitrate dehydratase PrpD|nr:MmgE/PrpD family protein [Rectinema sp.]HPN03053.1 MmgE/PrpD family protein [Rectinema sp.]
MEETQKLAEFLCKTSYQSIPTDAVEHAKLCILDCLGVTIAATKKDMATMMVNFAQEMGGKKEATIIGKGVRTNVLLASLVNGALSHLLDFDDVHALSGIHPSINILPAALAVAESKKLSGRDLLTAFILGFETEARIGIAAGLTHYEHGWHSTATIGNFGAAAAVGKLLNLTPTQMVYALGMAGTQAAGLRQMFGTMCKPFHAGKAGMNGVIAAYLAAKGFTSSPDVIEGKGGFLEVYSKNPQPEKVLADLGNDYQVLATGFKLHASCRVTHATIDGMKIIREEMSQVNIQDIEKIQIKVPQIVFQAAGKQEPKTGLEGKFSIYFCAALSLLHGKASEDMFTDEKVNDPLLIALRRKVEAKLDESLGIFEAKIAVRLKNGKTYQKHILAPKGEPENPITFAELEDKFENLTAMVIPKENYIKLAEMIRHLEEVTNVNEVIALTCPFYEKKCQAKRSS